LTLTETIFRRNSRTEHKVAGVIYCMCRICHDSCPCRPPHSIMADDPYRSTDLSLTIPERIQAYFRSCTDAKQYEGFETYPLQQATLFRTRRCCSKLCTVLLYQKSFCNKDANLHGGAATTLLDNLRTTAQFTPRDLGSGITWGQSITVRLVSPCRACRY
jgi:hypothetical protein